MTSNTLKIQDTIRNQSEKILMTRGKLDKVHEQEFTKVEPQIVNKYMRKLFMLNCKQKYKLKLDTFILLN